MSTSIATAFALTKKDQTTYCAYLDPLWCIGSVPHGGYLTSLILRAAALHHPEQPHCLSLHLTFLRRTSVGPCIITISTSKLGSRTSTFHIALQNQSSPSVTLIAGYITVTHLAREIGISLDTNWSLGPAPVPIGAQGTASLRDGSNEYWEEEHNSRYKGFRKAVQHVRMWVPRKGQPHESMVDEWIRWAESGAKLKQEDLGFVADMFPLVVDKYRDSERKRRKTEHASETAQSAWAPSWYPTVSLTLDMKKALPKEGVEFLFVRARAKQIRNGRFDLEIIIMDETGELVALSNHVVLALSADRNTAPRGQLTREKESKI